LDTSRAGRSTARADYRRDLARPVEVLDPEAGTTLVSPLDTAEQALAMVVNETVRRALQQLPTVQRRAIALMDLYGFTATQVAAMTGAPRGTILARVHRGHKRLATLLQWGVASADGACAPGLWTRHRRIPRNPAALRGDGEHADCVAGRPAAEDEDRDIGRVGDRRSLHGEGRAGRTLRDGDRLRDGHDVRVGRQEL
jgi:hypothetical protein